MKSQDAGPALPRVVIVGAGFGGLQAAKHLRDAPARIIVIDKENHHLFQPLLYQVATAGLSPAEISAPIRNVLRRHENAEVLMTEAVGIDLPTKTLLTKHGDEPFDTLVLATGARYTYFGHPEWESLAPSLKSVGDALWIRRKILTAFEAAEMEPDPEKRRRFLTFVLVGGGPTGAEMAGAMAELAHKALAKDFRRINPRSARIVLVEGGPRILSAFPEDLARKATRSLERLGVEVRTGKPVQSVDEGGVTIGGERIEAATVLWTAGVVATPVGRWLGAETDRAGRVIVGPDLSVPGHPDVFVIGDAASVKTPEGKLLPGVAPVAMQQGRYVARVIRDRLAGRTEAPPPFRYFDKGNLATVGRSFAIADLGWLKLSGFVGWVVWLVVHIFYLIGFRNRVIVLIQWAWLYLTFRRGARLITPVEKSPSRSLTR